MRLGGPQGWSGHSGEEENLFSLPRLEPRARPAPEGLWIPLKFSLPAFSYMTIGIYQNIKMVFIPFFKFLLPLFIHQWFSNDVPRGTSERSLV